jgi:hypothetical protein
MLKIPKRNVSRLQNFTDGGVPIESNYLIFNEPCLDSILESVNKKELFTQGKVICAICKETVKQDNLRAIVPNGTGTDFLCIKPHCIDKYFYSRTKR